MTKLQQGIEDSGRAFRRVFSVWCVCNNPTDLKAMWCELGTTIRLSTSTYLRQTSIWPQPRWDLCIGSSQHARCLLWASRSPCPCPHSWNRFWQMHSRCRGFTISTPKVGGYCCLVAMVTTLWDPQPHQSRHQKGKRLQGAPGIEQKRVKEKNLRSRHSHFTLMLLDANLVWKRNLRPEFGAHAMHPGVATLSLVLSKSNLISWGMPLAPDHNDPERRISQWAIVMIAQ